MAKHLGMSERTMIEKGLILGNSFHVIGRMIGRSPTTVSREVRKRRTFISRSGHQRNDCLHFNSCLRKNLCPDETQYSCFSRCKLCKEHDCREYCGNYMSNSAN